METLTLGAKGRVAILVLVGALLILLASQPPAVHAATLTVTNTSDSDAGSLRQAIADAASGDTINFSLSGCPCTINLASAIYINKNLTITGPGIDQLTLNGASGHRVVNIEISLTVSLYGMTIRNGSVALDGAGIFVGAGDTVTLDQLRIVDNSATGTGSGGGIYNNGGTLTVSNSRVATNSAAAGGGITNYYGTLTLNNVIVEGNIASNQGGGIYNEGTGAMTLVNVGVLGNSAATTGGGIINFATNPATITNSVIDSNVATSNYGGGLHNSIGATLTLTNVTVSRNKSSSYGGGVTNSGTLNLINNTVAYNLYINTPNLNGLWNTGTLSLRNTIVANNDGGNCGGGASITSNGNNLDSGNTCGFSASGDLHDSDPVLDFQVNTGTRSQGYPLGAASPAINAGNATTCAAAVGSPTFGAGGKDQRSYDRRSGNCDIGAFEAQPTTVTATGGTPQSATINAAFGTALSVNVRDAYANALGGSLVTFSCPASSASASLSSSTATTNASGATSVNATANGTAGGPYTVSASIPGATTAEFALTNNVASTTTTLLSSANPSVAGQSVSFTAQVTSSAGTPTGMVTFKDGATTLGTGTLNGSGQATLTTAALSAGAHSITALYETNGNYSSSTSAALTQNVNARLFLPLTVR